MPYPPVPMYTEISHFRAPYKDSLMGFGRSDAASSTSVSRASVASDGRVTVTTGSAGVSAKGASPKIGVSTTKAPPAPPVVAQKPPIPSLELDRNAEYSLNNLVYLVNIAAYGPDPRLWQYKPKISFSQQWSIASAAMVDSKSQWRKDFRTSILNLMRSYEESSVLKAGLIAFNRILKASYGWSLPSLIAGTALDPAAAVAGATAASKTIPQVWATREEAIAAAGTSGQLPVEVSTIPVPTQIAIQDALVADCHGMKAFLANFVAGVKKAAGKKGKGSGKLSAADERASDQAKKDADTASKRAEDSLAKAKQENESLKQALEDMKASLQQEPPAPIAPPEIGVPPSVPPVAPPPDLGTSRLEIFGFEMTTTKLLAIGVLAAGGYYLYSRKKA